MKILLNILIAYSIISCDGQTEQRQSKEELATESADTTQLSELLRTDEPQNLLTGPSEPASRRKTISFNSLTPSPCNINVILYSHENIDSLSRDAIDVFLSVFSEECNNNAEFSQFSQEMIFEIFGKYPRQVTELITLKAYNLDAITSELQSPLLDPLVEPIIMDIKSTGIKNAKIDSVIIALERANEYLNGG